MGLGAACRFVALLISTRAVQAQTNAPSAAPTSSGEDFPILYIIIAAAGGGVLIILAICCLCWCRRGHKRINTGVGSNPQNRKYFGKGRIPNFDPDEEMMFDAPFTDNGVKKNPLRDSQNSSVDEEGDPRQRLDTDFGSSPKNKSDKAKRNTVYPKVNVSEEEAGPLVLDQGNGVLRVEATVRASEVLGLETKPRESVRGIVISGIQPGSAADRWKTFGVGDVMLSINGKDVLNASHEAVKLALEVCGNKVALEVLTSKSAHIAASKRPGSVYNPTKTIDTETGVSRTEGREHDNLFAAGVLADSPKLTHKALPALDRNTKPGSQFSRQATLEKDSNNNNNAKLQKEKKFARQPTMEKDPNKATSEKKKSGQIARQPTLEKNSNHNAKPPPPVYQRPPEGEDMDRPSALHRQLTKIEITDEDMAQPLPDEPLLNGGPSARNEAEQTDLMRFQTGVIRSETAVRHSLLHIERSEGLHEADTDELAEAPSTLSHILTDPTVDGPHPSLLAQPNRSKGRAAPPPAPTDVSPVTDFDTTKLFVPQEEGRGSITKTLDDGSTRPRSNTEGTQKRKRTKTIKKEAGKLLVRLKQLVDGIDDPKDLPEYSVVKLSLIEEFGKEFFDAQEAYVMSWLAQIGMSKFDVSSSSDPMDRSVATISRRGGRLKSVSGGVLSDMFKKKKNERTASAWFKEITIAGKKRKRYCEMKGAEITMLEKVRKALVVRDSIVLSSKTSIQRHGYELYIINPDDRITLQAESEDVCQEWYSQLRATYIEICEKIDLEAFQNLVVDAQPPPPASPPKTTLMAIGGLENSGGGGGGGGGGQPSPVTKSPEQVKNEPKKEEVVVVELTAEEKAEKRAKARAALAEKRAAAKLARTANIDTELHSIFAYIDGLDEDNC
eukprot:m.61227 g.61227  ORF g.61227 m.61227 type:complete len:894 (-) comp22951_c1_seq1:256-2937(-)